MKAISPSIVSADECRMMEQIAQELDDPRLPTDRRTVLNEVLDQIAERYACDPRFTDS